ncbi:hypothetical protein [Flavobacterium poyangense]|uniref:hypothetical protein n=1 Tax=Flavobacterium poyangense TaxID=2204302 RepID=UPI00141FD0AA|nr:hypothetical protein [Flavobacterium sp. JXAS1]
MRKLIYIYLFSISFTMFAQSKESGFFSFYRGGNKYKKSVKYLLFDLSKADEKKEHDGKTYFYLSRQTFVYDKKKHKIDTFSLNSLKEYKLENPKNLQENAYKFYKEKKSLEEKRMNLKSPIMYPLTEDYGPFFRIFILEKINQNTLLKYEVDWKYSMF